MKWRAPGLRRMLSTNITTQREHTSHNSFFLNQSTGTAHIQQAKGAQPHVGAPTLLYPAPPPQDRTAYENCVNMAPLQERGRPKNELHTRTVHLRSVVFNRTNTRYNTSYTDYNKKPQPVHE